MLAIKNKGRFVKQITKEMERKIIEVYLSGKAMVPTGKMFNIAGSTVCNILKLNNITTRDNRKYVFNECYFDVIDTEEKAYWLGFLMGDGSVVGNTLSISLNEKDVGQLKKFKKALEATYEIKYCESNNSCYIYVISEYFVKKLSYYGIVPNKDFVTCTPNISIILLQAFYRGCIDADGSLGKYKQDTTWQISLAGTERLLIECSEYISRKLNIKKRTLSPRGNSFAIVWDGNQLASKVAKFVYARSTIFLDRKKALFDQMEQDLKIINAKKNRHCSVDGCNRKNFARGCCSKHYQQLDDQKKYRRKYYADADREEVNRKAREYYHNRKNNAF